MQGHFQQFGTVKDCVVMRDPDQDPGIRKNRFDDLVVSSLMHHSLPLNTHTPTRTLRRGFGFVTFEDSAAVAKVLAMPVHIVDGKNVSVYRWCLCVE